MLSNDNIETWMLWLLLYDRRPSGWGLCPLSAGEIIDVMELYKVYDKTTTFELIVAMYQTWIEWFRKDQ